MSQRDAVADLERAVEKIEMLRTIGQGKQIHPLALYSAHLVYSAIHGARRITNECWRPKTRLSVSS